jgi:hypothetical protein
VTGEQKRERSRQVRRQIGRVRENYWNTTQSAALGQRARNIVIAGKTISDTNDRERSAAHRPIFENGHAGSCEGASNGSGGRPQIVVAENRYDAIGRAQSSQEGCQPVGTLNSPNSVVSRQEVARDQYQVGMCRIHLISDVEQSLRLHAPVAEVDVRKQSYFDRRCPGRQTL